MRFHLFNACCHSQPRVRRAAQVLLLSCATVATVALPAVAQSSGQPQGCQCPTSDQAAAAAAAEVGCVSCEQNPYADRTACDELGHRLWNLGNRCCPVWDIRADALVLERGNTRNQGLFTDTGATTELLNSERDLNFPVAYGFQLAGIRRLRDDISVEIGYFQLDGWEATSTIPGASRMILDDAGHFYNVTNAAARYTSAIYMGEVNLREEVTGWLTVLAGARFGELDERYRATATGGSLVNNAFNHLYGGQVGADLEVYNNGQWRLNGLCKAGLYANYANQNSSDGVASIADSRQSTTFMGETGAVLTYQVNEHLSFRAIGQAAWLQGVALAPEQARANDFAGEANVNMTGSLFYYGAGLGCEIQF